MSVWTQLDESEQDEVTAQFVDVITICKSCPEPVQAILNLAEFMDHSEKGPLPINFNMLIECAESTRAYAKAYRYNELSISEKEVPSAEDCQTIIAFANKLNLEEASIGIVKFAENHNMTISGRWYEKLGEWEKALEMYTNGEETQSDDEEEDQTMLNQMRCLEALGRWNELNDLSETVLEKGLFSPEEPLFRLSNMHERQKFAQIAARGYWAVGNYEKMENFVEKINVNNSDGSFLRAVLSIRNNKFADAAKYINRVS
jgi:FKBP12-rapamycin complex-associated protein